MKLKMKLMAAAVALAAGSGANAAMTTMASGDSSLAFIVLDSVTGQTSSATMDLGFDLNSFLPAAKSTAGTKIVWDFGANTLTVNGVAQTGDYAWSSALASFNSVAITSANRKWGVIAGDTITAGTPGDFRILSTSNTALSTIQTQTKSALANFSLSDNVFTQNNLLPSHTTHAEGGSSAVSGLAYIGNGGTFGTAGKWQNNATFVALAAEGTAQKFYMLDTNNGTLASRALVTQYAAANPLGPATFSYNDGVLTYAVPIPEPETYALLLAGLGMMGFMGRRRLTNRA